MNAAFRIAVRSKERVRAADLPVVVQVGLAPDAFTAEGRAPYVRAASIDDLVAQARKRNPRSISAIGSSLYAFADNKSLNVAQN